MLNPKNLSSVLLATALAFVLASQAEPVSVDVEGWDKHFAFHYDHVLAETAGLDREFEPVEVTLSVPGEPEPGWQDHVRVVRLTTEGRGEVVPHETLGKVSVHPVSQGDARTPAPVESVNVVFLAPCPAGGETTYRLFWGLPADTNAPVDLPAAEESNGLTVTGEAPGLVVSNDQYTICLDPKSGAIMAVNRAGQGEDKTMSFRKVPMHFGTDVWSPPQGWDHDYDWATPPNQRCEGGATALRYHRWGPMQSYRDVVVSITYTFYAHVPYVHVSSTMNFTENRSVHAVRMGEIVVSHTRTPEGGGEEGEGEGRDVFPHIAWPNADGSVFVRDVNAHRDAEGLANVEGVVPGALGILDRDVPWVAGYNAAAGYGLASLRKSQFAGNQLGSPIPQSVPCTYIANYGWGFTYWSRPMVYPPGSKGTVLDQNTAVAAGTFFATEEALLVFEPDPSLREVGEAHQRFLQPLRHQFKGTGPW
jgi:hypothetical protein